VQRNGITRIRFRSPDAGANDVVEVLRTIGRYGGVVDVNDEVFSAQQKTGSSFNYRVTLEPELRVMDRGQRLTPTEHMRGVVERLSGLVAICGATIDAINRDFGPEALFVSDGTQWVSRQTNEYPLSPPAAITDEPPALGG
jgi:hypothetical protein